MEETFSVRKNGFFSVTIKKILGKYNNFPLGGNFFLCVSKVAPLPTTNKPTVIVVILYPSLFVFTISLLTHY